MDITYDMIYKKGAKTLLMLNKNEIAIFKQLQTYIDEHYVPPRFRETDKDDFYDQIFDIRKIDFAKKIPFHRKKSLCFAPLKKSLTFFKKGLGFFEKG